jgi:lactate permease
MAWNQVYNPLNNPILSTACAALPIFVLLSGLAFFHIKAHVAAILGLIAAAADGGSAGDARAKR